jgi:hypothetical protein
MVGLRESPKFVWVRLKEVSVLVSVVMRVRQPLRVSLVIKRLLVTLAVVLVRLKAVSVLLLVLIGVWVQVLVS